jgi:hypothetical protein
MQPELVEVEGKEWFVVREEDCFGIACPVYWAARQVAILGSRQDKCFVFFGKDDCQLSSSVGGLIEYQQAARVG